MREIQVRTRNGEVQTITVDLDETHIQYISDSHNEKTGIVPAQFIGATREESEATCRMCPLWKANTCYAQDGSPRLGHAAVLRVVREGEDRSIEHALDNAKENAKIVRFGSIGDPGSILPDVYEKHETECRERGFKVMSYTHQWYLEHAKHLKGHALASADTMEDAVDAVKDGWRVAMHVDEKHKLDGKTLAEKPQGELKNGIKFFMCPAQRTDNKVTCNDCGLCDGTKQTKYNTIMFVEHGQQMKFAKQRAKRPYMSGLTRFH